MQTKEFLRKVFGNNSDSLLAVSLAAHVRESSHAAVALSRLMAQVPTGVKEQLAIIVTHEHAGDKLTKKLRTHLDEVFILKQLSKDHVSRLVTHLDDILDDMRDAAHYIDTYMIDEATQEALQFAAEIAAMVSRLSGLIERLLELTTREVETAFAELRKIEGNADDLRRNGTNALARRYKEATDVQERTEALYLLVVWKDIYAKLERVTDHCTHAVNEVAIMVRTY